MPTRLILSLTCVLLALLALLPTPQRGLACCMVPVTYKGSISQDAQEAILIHDGNREELILRINYKITGAKMPEKFGMVTDETEPQWSFPLSAQLVTGLQ